LASGAKAFATTAAYDSAIAATLASTSLNESNTQFQLPQGNSDFPSILRFSLSKAMDLRYGENPHQRAAMYSDGSGTVWLTANSFRAKNFPLTTLWICRRPGIWPGIRRNRMRHHQAHEPVGCFDWENAAGSVHARQGN